MNFSRQNQENWPLFYEVNKTKFDGVYHQKKKNCFFCLYILSIQFCIATTLNPNQTKDEKKTQGACLMKTILFDITHQNIKGSVAEEMIGCIQWFDYILFHRFPFKLFYFFIYFWGAYNNL